MCQIEFKNDVGGERDGTHPVKALGLEEVSVDSVELPPSSGPAAVDRF